MSIIVESEHTSMTPGVLEKIGLQYAVVCLGEHMKGNWGNMPEEDKKTNAHNLLTKGMLMSVWSYLGREFYIITDPGWQVTTILLPDEY